MQMQPLTVIQQKNGSIQAEVQNKENLDPYLYLWHGHCLSNALDRPALDRPSNRFFPSVCVSVNRSVIEQLCPQFFTDFHEILHAAQKSGRFIAYCL